MSLKFASDKNIKAADLTGKTAVVLGVADRESLAWAIARNLVQAGATVVVGYQHKFFSRVSLLLKEEPSIRGQRCDILNPDELEEFFQKFSRNGLDILVHSIAFGPVSIFTNPPSEVSASDFSETLEISAHSLAKVVRFSKPFLNPAASVVTLSFQASQRAMPFYGMMGVAKAALESLVRYLAVELGRDGVRVNAVSAGPVETLAALSEIVAIKRNPGILTQISDPGLRQVFEEMTTQLGQDSDEIEFAKACWRKIQEKFAQKSALTEILSADDVAQAVLFFASDASKKITGQILNVDCGYSACQWV